MSWLTGWSYRRAIIIAPSADGAQTDYQMKLLVGQSAGSSGAQVHCTGQVLSSFNDLRFTTSDGETLCPYWVETITGVTPNQLATVWVKVLSIAAHPDDTTIYMYYGNAAVSAASSGVNTFIDFDDFEASPGGIGWTDVNSSIDFNNTEQKWGGSRSMKQIGNNSHYSEGTRSLDAAGKAIRVRVRHNVDDYSGQFIFGNGSKGFEVAIAFASQQAYYWDGLWHSAGATTFPKDTWMLLELRNFNFTAGTFDIYKDDSLVKSGATMFSSSAYSGIIDFYGTGVTGRDCWRDNYIIRKFTANEPAWSNFGTEEYLPPPPPEYHIILSAVYSEESPEVNRAFVIGTDAAGGQVSGSAVTQDEVDLVGERMEAHHDSAIPTAAVAAAVAAAMLDKCSLDGRRAELFIPPHCGLELWDVLAVLDTVANQDTLYRVAGYELEYDTSKGVFLQRLKLCDV